MAKRIDKLFINPPIPGPTSHLLQILPPGPSRAHKEAGAPCSPRAPPGRWESPGEAAREGAGAAAGPGDTSWPRGAQRGGDPERAKEGAGQGWEAPEGGWEGRREAGREAGRLGRAALAPHRPQGGARYLLLLRRLSPAPPSSPALPPPPQPPPPPHTHTLQAPGQPRGGPPSPSQSGDPPRRGAAPHHHLPPSHGSQPRGEGAVAPLP